MSFSEEKRKKLIVPAVALMMCAVAVIGIGYAAISTYVQSGSNTVTNQSFYIDLSEDGSFTTMPSETPVDGFFTGTITKTSQKVNGTINYVYHSTAATYLKVLASDGTKTKCNLNIQSNVGGLNLEFYEVTSATPATNPSSDDVTGGIKFSTTTITDSAGTTITNVLTNKVYCVVIKSITSDHNENNFEIKITAS